MREARAEIRSHPGLKSERKVTKGSARAPQDALPRVHACSAAPIRWHVCSSLEAVETRWCAERRGLGTCAPPPSSELADVRERPSPPEPAGRDARRTRRERGGGGYLGFRVRQAGARTREAHLLADAPGRSRPAP